MAAYRLLYLTVPNREAGRALARRMVEERLAACAHLLPAGESFYRWEGALMEEAELVIIAKTRADLAETAIARIAEWHEYEVPCVLALPIEEGHQPFLRWIDEAIG
jgi:periplasmic divalent cation tolerance protein